MFGIEEALSIGKVGYIMGKIIKLLEIEKRKQYSVVSLFAGAGGLDIGFEKQGFKTVRSGQPRA